MKHIVKLNKYDEIDEMAKLWPVGSIVKAKNTYDTKSTYSASRAGRKWNSHNFSVESEAMADGAFYMKVEFSGRAWIEGTVIYVNSSKTYVAPGSIVKIPVESATTPGPELKVLDSNKAEIQKAYGKTMFIDGKEPGLMTVKGETVKDLPEGEYSVTSVNFGLSKDMEEPIVTLCQKRGREVVCVKLSDLDSLGQELSTEHNEVIADWFSKKTGMEIKWDGSRFNTPQYKIVSSTNEMGNSFSASPFYSMEDANKFIEVMKKHSTVSYDTSNLSVRKDYSSNNNNLDDMIKIVRKLGVEVSMKELIALKKGHVGAKKLGLLDSLEWKPGKKD
jgi:hypothetical protein